MITNISSRVLLFLFLSILFSQTSYGYIDSNFDFDIIDRDDFKVTQYSSNNYEYNIRIKGDFYKKKYKLVLINIYKSELIENSITDFETTIESKNGEIEFSIPKYIIKADYYIFDMSTNKLIYYDNFFKLYIPLIDELNILKFSFKKENNDLYIFLNSDAEDLRKISNDPEYKICYYDIFRETCIKIEYKRIEEYCIKIEMAELIDKFPKLNKKINTELNQIYPMLGELRVYHRNTVILKAVIDILFSENEP